MSEEILHPPQTLRERWETRYDGSKPRPWDTGITPPEIVRFWQIERRIPAQGLAVDVGCGTGTNALFLAKQGLSVLGVDLSGRALQMAHRRVQETALASRILFAQVNVGWFPLAAASAIYVMDVGCLHGVPVLLRNDYAQTIIRGTKSGAFMQIFGFDKEPGETESSVSGYGPTEVADLFGAGKDGAGFDLLEIEQGRPDRRPCRWYLLRRR